MGKPTTALIVLVICVLSVGALADWEPGDPNTKWVQEPDLCGWDVQLTTPKLLADDFLCDETGWITDVHFWGSWKDDVVGEITNIHLSIHQDIPVGPNGYSVPGKQEWAVDIDPACFPDAVVIRRLIGCADQGWYDPNTGEVLENNHKCLWQVNVYLDQILPWDELFIQQGTRERPTVYWLDLQVSLADPEQTAFGWKTAYEQHRDDAAWADWSPGTPLPTEDDWTELMLPDTEESLDLAFVITGIPIPEPGLLAIAGLGLIALLRRRR